MTYQSKRDEPFMFKKEEITCGYCKRTLPSKYCKRHRKITTIRSFRAMDYEEHKRIVQTEVRKELEHVESDARWFPNEDLYGVIKVKERLAQLNKEAKS